MHVRSGVVRAVAGAAGLIVGAVAGCQPAARGEEANASAEVGSAVDAESTPKAGFASHPGSTEDSAFDLVFTAVRREGDELVFVERVSGRAGVTVPTPAGKLAGAEVFSYVWPTSLDPSVVEFEEGTGTLALAATSHPDFDDTPLYDEDGDGDNGNDGRLWHSHWVVLTPDPECGAGSLKVRDIPEGAEPRLPATWPGLPLFIDSPGYEPDISGAEIRVPVPLKELGFPADFSYDGVTAALRVNESVHNPLLCVSEVFDVASGDLSLPGTVG